MNFSTQLIAWYNIHKRDLPWRRTTNPYQVWLSEIMLQQTRVDQGMSYYLKFIKAYPTIHDLAKASEDHVLANWQGLGYYSRARNLHATAKYISSELKGIFPSTYKNIIKLKGVGPYTAAAIASFCFKEVVPVVDGNVLRVMARYMGIEEPINWPKTHKRIYAICREAIPQKQPDVFNQAIMEFGALHCTPKKPQCDRCPFQTSCKAYEEKTVALLPKKEKKIKKINRYFDYIFFYQKNTILIKKRQGKGIWQGLYEGHLIESKEEENTDKILESMSSFLNKKTSIQEITPSKKHILSHQNLHIRYWFIAVENPEQLNQIKKSFTLTSWPIHQLKTVGFPIVSKNALEKYFKK